MSTVRGRGGTAVVALVAVLVSVVGCTEPAGRDPWPANANRPATSKATVMREGNKTYIAGLETFTWGGTSDRQNSVIACLEAAASVMGDKVDYAQLMGASALAFRIQHMWCPSSPHAYCGRGCGGAAAKALGYELTNIPTMADDKPTARVEEARAAIVASIDAGVPVLWESEEDGLVVGYLDGGKTFLLRPYSPKQHGYVPVTDKWPWGVALIKRRPSVPSRKETAVAALQAAVEMSRTPNYGNYASGLAAYEEWAAELEDEGRFADMDQKKFFSLALGNGFTYGSLENARKCAPAYLRAVASDFKPAAAAHIRKAAEQYDAAYAVIAAERADVQCAWSLTPWQLKTPAAWTPQMRRTQAKVLREMAASEKQAVAEIEAALAAEGGRGISPVAESDRSVMAKNALISLIRQNPKMLIGNPDPDHLAEVKLIAVGDGKYHLGAFEIDTQAMTYNAMIGENSPEPYLYKGVFVAEGDKWMAKNPSVKRLYRKTE